MKNKRWLFASLLLLLSLVLIACSGNGDKETNKKDKAGGAEPETEEKEDFTDFSTSVSNTDEPLEDGELNYGIVLDTPFEGTLSPVFYTLSPDSEIMSLFDENLLATDENFLITNEGAAEYEISEDNKTIAITIKDGVNWHDGEPVRASDLLYAYELLGHPEYMGTRYTYMISNVIGMPEYQKGEAEEVSGIEISDDDKTITISYKEATPSVMSGIWTRAVPRHHVGDITTGEVTMDELVSSPKIRVEPIGFGPYKVKKIVAGESVQYERNEDYWRGQPAVQSIILKIISGDSALKAFETGELDMAEFPVAQYTNALLLDNVELLGRIGQDYDYIGFKLGTWDKEKRENVVDPTSKVADKRVRQALAHAMDTDVVSEEIYNGLRVPATTAIPRTFGFHDETNPGIPYDPEKAMALLDEAGYVDVDGDGIRENPDGEEFILTYMAQSGSEVAEPMAEHYIQNWEEVGIKVELLHGRLHEYMSFYDMLDGDEPGIDLYSGAWSVGSDPDPSSIHGRTAAYNYTRYASDKNDELLAAGTSEEAFDLAYRKDIYNEWQELMTDEAWLSPTLYRYNLMMVNKRVTNYTMEPGEENSRPWKWGVSEEDPVK